MQKEDWGNRNRNGSLSLTQILGKSLFEGGFEALLVPSFAFSGFKNLVIFPKNLRKGSTIAIVHESKLPAKK